MSLSSRISIRGIVVTAAALVCAACGGGAAYSPTAPAGGTSSAATPTAGAVVAMTSANDGYGSTSNTFAPADAFILRNGTVTWNNGSGRMHNVTFAATAGAPTNIAGYGSGSQDRTFTSSGTFAYDCTLHSGMSGVVRVQ